MTMVVITFEEGWEKGLKVSFEKIIDFLDSDQTGESPLTNEVWRVGSVYSPLSSSLAEA